MRSGYHIPVTFASLREGVEERDRQTEDAGDDPAHAGLGRDHGL